MILTYTNLLRRYADARPGLKLVAVEDAAIPVTLLRTDVLLQEKRSLPAIDEFFLRFTEAGVNTVDDIARYLGLPSDLVLDAAVRQTSAGHLIRSDSKQFTLTSQGVAFNRELVASQPELKEISFVFDRLAWLPAPYPQASLLRRRDAVRAGLLLVPAAATAAISTNDITTASLNRILPGSRATVLRVNRLAGRRHLWAPAKLLVFGDSASQELELAVYVDDEISAAHEAALQEADASTRLQMTIAPLPFVPQPRFGVNVGTGAEQSDVLSVEHHDHLLHALLHAKQRLLIASHGAREDTVTDNFCRYLKDRARSGTRVTIIIDDESHVDRNAADRLRKLSQTAPNVTVSYADLAGTSYLIHDDLVIETTFDWLSGGRNGREYSWHAGRLSRSSSYVAGVSAQLRDRPPR